jgi:hypothetical protein
VKSQYLAKKHPDVVQNKRTIDNVLVEFLETFDVHHNLGSNSSQYVTNGEWDDYFTSLSALEESDERFAAIMKNTFDLKPPKQVQSPAKYIPDDFHEVRDTMKGGPVVRSGMGSDLNPLNTTKDYYPKVNNASRGNATGAQMYSYARPVQVDEQKPKDSYASFTNKP